MKYCVQIPFVSLNVDATLVDVTFRQRGKKLKTDDGRPKVERRLHSNSYPTEGAEEIWVGT